MPLNPVDTTTDHGSYKGDPAKTAFNKLNDNDVYLEQQAQAAYDHASSGYRKSNIVGQVGQTGGVPTGAIIETGTNGNGTYVRYADGTQLCFNNLDYTLPAGTAGYQAYYAAAFVAQPVVVPSIVAGNSLVRVVGVEAVTSTFFSGYHQNGAGQTSARFQFIAIGRWF